MYVCKPLVLFPDHDVAINRYSRLSKRRENDRVCILLTDSLVLWLWINKEESGAAYFLFPKYLNWLKAVSLNWQLDSGEQMLCVYQVQAEAVEDVYTSRKKQHQTMMHYFCSLNTLQYKKKMALLEPLLGYMQAQVCAYTHKHKHTHTLTHQETVDKNSSVKQSKHWKPYPVCLLSKPVSLSAVALIVKCIYQQTEQKHVWPIYNEFITVLKAANTKVTAWDYLLSGRQQKLHSCVLFMHQLRTKMANTLNGCVYSFFFFLYHISVHPYIFFVFSLQISFFKLGSENLTQQWEDFLATIGTSVQK